MNRRRKYVYLHWFHAALVTLLLLTGLIWLMPGSKAYIGEWKSQWILLHSILGILYLLCVLMAIPMVFRFAKGHPRWQKTFHICLQWCLCFGWSSTGIFLWLNPPFYLGIRSSVLLIHDVLTWFVIPWIAGHVILWTVQRKRLKNKPRATIESRDRGALLTRREVLYLFLGAGASLFLGGILRWFQPVSIRFLTSLDHLQKKGYFRIYSVVSENPVFDPTKWKLTIDGKVEKHQSLTLEEITKLPKLSFTSDFHCVTGWSVFGVQWTGVPMTAIVDLVKPNQDVQFVKLYSSDRFYTECYKMDQIKEKNVILAYLLDGKPLNENQGAPLRMFHPRMYGYKSIKWLERIEFTNEFQLGYWEEKEGYDPNGYHI